MDSTSQGAAMDGTQGVHGSFECFGSGQLQCFNCLVFGALPGIWLFRKGQSRCCFGILEIGFRPESGWMECIHVLGQGADCIWLCLAVWHVQFLRIFLLLSSSAGDLFGNRPTARYSAMVDRLNFFQREAEDFLRRQCQKQQKRPKHELFKPIASVAVEIPLGAVLPASRTKGATEPWSLFAWKRGDPLEENSTFASFGVFSRWMLVLSRIWMYLDGCANGCARVILCQCRSSRIVRKP